MKVVPTPAEVQDKLRPMTMAQLESLASKCRVPFTTLVKVRNGQTTNPRLETVVAIWPHIAKEADPSDSDAPEGEAA